jgi:hypothetical protein
MLRLRLVCGSQRCSLCPRGPLARRDDGGGFTPLRLYAPVDLGSWSALTTRRNAPTLTGADPGACLLPMLTPLRMPPLTRRQQRAHLAVVPARQPSRLEYNAFIARRRRLAAGGGVREHCEASAALHDLTRTIKSKIKSISSSRKAPAV